MHMLLPTNADELLFSRLDREAAERHGAIGYLRADFGRDGRGFFATWFGIQTHLNTPALKTDFRRVINSLRGEGPEPPFASRISLEAFCAAKLGKDLATRGSGYSIQTREYSYYFRCRPSPADYDIYCFAYDNRWLLPELAGQHKLPVYCLSLLPSTGELISIVRERYAYNRHSNSTPFSDVNRSIADKWNAHDGVTRAQEKAMLAGSLFGWDKPAAKPWNYDQDGKPWPLPPHKDAPVR